MHYITYTTTIGLLSSCALWYSIVTAIMKQILEDDDRDPVSLLIKRRFPWLLIGLLGGVVATILSSRFETVLSQNINLAFFIPVIVYMADAVGTQTETVYVRNIADGKLHFGKYLAKETALGIVLGVVFGILLGAFAYFWLNSFGTAVSVALSLCLTMTSAPIIALCIPAMLNKIHNDPAIGAGPMTTVIQDLLSLSIYFVIATIVLL